jgi:hypothetical protein
MSTKKIEAMTDDALAYMRSRRSGPKDKEAVVVYFPELIKALTERGYDCNGMMSLVGDSHPHVVLWVNVNEDFCFTVNALLKSGHVVKWASAQPVLTAMLHPELIPLPLATTARIKRGKKDCWLPSGLKLLREDATQ